MRYSSFSQVDAAEGRDLSRRHDAFAFHEVSVADQPSDTVDVMNKMVAQIWKEKVNERRESENRGSIHSPGRRRPWPVARHLGKLFCR